MVARNTSYLPPKITNFIVFLKQSKETDLPIYNIMIFPQPFGKIQNFQKNLHWNPIVFNKLVYIYVLYVQCYIVIKVMLVVDKNLRLLLVYYCGLIKVLLLSNFFSLRWNKLEIQMRTNWLPQILPGWYCSSPQWDPHERRVLAVWWTSPASQVCWDWGCCSTAPPGRPDSGPRCWSEIFIILSPLLDENSNFIVLRVSEMRTGRQYIEL